MKTQEAIKAVMRKNMPANQPWFETLAIMPEDRLLDPVFVGKLHDFIQVVRHSTLLSTFNVPNFTTLELSGLKISVINQIIDAIDHTEFVFVQALKARQTLPISKLDSLFKMRKLLPRPLLPILDSMNDFYQGSCGAFALSEMAVAEWNMAMEAVFEKAIPVLPEFANYTMANTAAAMVDDVVNTDPDLEGNVMRGMVAAMEQWKRIWQVQYEMIMQQKG